LHWLAPLAQESQAWSVCCWLAPPGRGSGAGRWATLDGDYIIRAAPPGGLGGPAVHVWNRSLYDNLRYGMAAAGAAPIGRVIQQADLFDVLDKLPNGLKTSLGEGGGLVSGGEGHASGLGAPFYARDVRLAILE